MGGGGCSWVVYLDFSIDVERWISLDEKTQHVEVVLFATYGLEFFAGSVQIRPTIIRPRDCIPGA